MTGVDKQLVGQVAANIRAMRKPDPYKQKGVRYTGEVLKKKQGKTGAGKHGRQAPGAAHEDQDEGRSARPDQAPDSQAGDGHDGAAAADRVPQPRPHVRAGDRRRHRQHHRVGSSLEPAVKASFGEAVRGGNKAGAEAVGRAIAERLKAKGITRVVFDRNGFLYHGRIKAIAEAARQAGLEF